jgi:hypothetical protein
MRLGWLIQVIDVTRMQRFKCYGADVSATGHFLLHLKVRKEKLIILPTFVNGSNHKPVQGKVEALRLVCCVVCRIFSGGFNVGNTAYSAG